MSRLARRPSGGRRPRRDRGAAAALVAVLLAGNVALGMGALVVDVGLLYAEREDLQAGADAVAVAVAKLCLADNDQCESEATTLARSYANRNARDGLADVEVCGRVLEQGSSGPNRLTPCKSSHEAGGGSEHTHELGGGSEHTHEPGGTLATCIGDPPPYPRPYVEARTSTLLPDGSTALPPAFAGAVTGTDGVTVGACSRVEWGPLAGARLDIAMAVSICDFDKATGGGTRYQPPPPSHTENDSDVDATRQATLSWRPPDAPRTCAGGAVPSGFGLLSGAGSDCRIDVLVGRWYAGTTTAGSPPGCGEAIHKAHHSLTPVAVAVFDDVGAGHHPDRYHVAGIAIFVITGWQESGHWSGGPDHDHAPDPTPKPPAKLCPSGGKTAQLCVYGYFTTRLFRTGTGDLGEDHFGSVYIRTIG